MTTDISIGMLHKDFQQNVTWADTGNSGDLNQKTGNLSIDMPDDRVFNTPSSLVYSVDEDFMYLGVKGLPTAQEVGVYSFKASKNDVITRSAVVVTFYVSTKMDSRTMTVGVGETVDISLDRSPTHPLSFRWRHNYGPQVPSWRWLSTIIIYNVRAKDGGVYECYFSINGRQGIMRLIVRDCPSPKWNPPGCEEDCPVCYNGGVCDDKTGVCVCPAGFMGEHCEKACESSNWGRYCDMKCESGNPHCVGMLLCPPDPVGCSCNRGYSGNDCQTECSGLKYGADCLQTCHCKQEDCDNSKGCRENATCTNGYKGPGCQVLNRECPHHTFGVLCNYPCHCKKDKKCNPDGSCDAGCLHGWAGHDCSIALPYRSTGPTVVSSTATTLTIDASWVQGEDYGTGSIVSTLVWYKYKTSSSDTFTSVNTTNNDDFITIDNISPDSHLVFYTQHSRMVAGVETYGPPSPNGYALIVCSKPLDEPTVELKAIEAHYIVLEVQNVSNAPERIQCNNILRYQVRYESIDGTVHDIVNTTDGYYRQVPIITSKCVAYNVYARIVNNRDIAGDWGEHLHIPPLAPSNNEDSTANETALIMRWAAASCVSYENIRYFYQLLQNGIVQQEGSTTATHVILNEGIEACESYTFLVWSSYLNSNGTVVLEDVVAATTYPGAPNITSLSTTSDSITIHWSPTDGRTLCDVIEYNVIITSCLFTINKLTTNKHLHVEENINPGTEYIVKIAARNIKGFGEFSPNIMITTDVENKESANQPGDNNQQEISEANEELVDKVEEDRIGTYCDGLEADLREMSEEDQRQLMKRINDVIFKF
ncbi:uncharacterized protein [Antedon mediterranea]|uniref:uncharacterized protein n=1 Tax=Antedon mediterranea TaxID=105859 RepID=UPI003AF9C284